MEVKIPVRKDDIAIVVVGYNRLSSIKRLLNSLIVAHYPEKQVPLVISIDCSGDEDLYQYVRDFKWIHGEKYVNIQKERLGLKSHIFQCGDLTRHFKAIVLLEDDLFVSPFFYEYVEKAIEAYGEEDAIAEISLYKNESNGYAGLPFLNIQDGNDVFLMQDVSTWGQCWTQQMWDKFVDWRDSHTEEDIQNMDMPERIKKWERAWSKYYNAYVVDTGRHVLYPNVSLTTNFSDAGEHGGTQNNLVQVNFLQGEKEYKMDTIQSLTKYDIYNNNEYIYKWIGIAFDDLAIDLYGIHNNLSKKYLLSTRKLHFPIIRSYALYMKPMELNIKYNVEGEGIYLYETTNNKTNISSSDYSEHFITYYLGGISDKVILIHCLKMIKKRISSVIRK